MSLLGLSALWLAGCVQDAYARLGHMPYEVALANKDSLGALVRERSEASDDRGAFYSAELARARRRSLELLSGERGRVDPALRDLSAHLDFAGEGVGKRGFVVKARPIELERGGGEGSEGGDEAFWKGVRVYESRLKTWMNTANASMGDLNTRAVYGSPFAIASAVEVAGALLPGEAIVQYYIDGDLMLGIVIAPEVFEVHRLEGAASLDGEVAALVEGISCVAAQEPCGQGAWEGPSRALYARLIGPLEGALSRAGVKTVRFVPDGPLVNMPFQVLMDGQGALLIERFGGLAMLPSSSFYLGVMARRRPQVAPRMLAIGDPASGWVPMPRLSAAAQEAAVLGDVYPGSTIWRGGAATEARFYAAVGQHNVLHMATHGLLLRSMPEATSLLLADGQGHDGLLTVAEIVALLDLSGYYAVVLSACQTSVAADARRDLTSLTGAFLMAGAPSVIGSLWHVDDASTAALMLTFYAQMVDLGPGEALRQAQLALRAEAGTRHPFFWSPFVLWGFDT